MNLLACPFCRQLYRREEGRDCPECGIALVRLERLPPSLDAQRGATESGEREAPEEERLPWTHVGGGRGPLMALALLGLATFFAPWVSVVRPDEVVWSGFELARRVSWLWGGAVGWFVLIALLTSRRSLAALRGIRVIAAVFSVMTLLEVAVLLVFSPTSHRYVSVEYDWVWGLYLSGFISVAATSFAVLLGGRATPEATRATADRLPVLESSEGRTLH